MPGGFDVRKGGYLRQAQSNDRMGELSKGGDFRGLGGGTSQNVDHKVIFEASCKGERGGDFFKGFEFGKNLHQEKKRSETVKGGDRQQK